MPIDQDSFDRYCEAHGIRWHLLKVANPEEIEDAVRWVSGAP